MQNKLKILFAASEAIPYAKTGGLADVIGTLPKELEKLGLDVRIVIPKYKTIYDQNINTTKIGEFSVNLADNIHIGEIEKTILPDSNVPVYFIKNDFFYYRDGIYQNNKMDYSDNSSRFIFFSRGVLELLKIIDFKPHIIHTNDWQTGLIPCYLKSELYSNDPFYLNIKTVFTIHNIAYQGLFWHLDMPLLGLDWSYFTQDKLEFYGKINFLKAGIVYADAITTVSSTYAKEIQTTEYGCGLEGIIKMRSKDLIGILNGVDYNIWNPETDSLIVKNYSANNIRGKSANKRELKRIFGLSNDKFPIIGMITRLVEQKGIPIIMQAMDELMKLDVQMVIMGTGNPEYESFFLNAKDRFKGKIGVNIAFNERLAHLIEAGSDMFLMPSRYEPCGLNHLYSLKYGTIPIARKTGGLADAIIPYDSQKGGGNGFLFEHYNHREMLKSIKEAIEIYHTKKWRKLISRAMISDFSWEQSARKYLEVYNKITV